MPRTITIEDAPENLAFYVDDISRTGESVVLIRGGKPVAEIRPTRKTARLSELRAILESGPRLTPEEAEDFARDVQEARRLVQLDELMAHYSDDDLFSSVVILSELLHGVHRANTPETRARRSEFVEYPISRIEVLDLETDAARVHAKVWAELQAKGTLIGAHDAWIAATALQHDLTLSTQNVEEFERVPGLRVEQWTGLGS